MNPLSPAIANILAQGLQRNECELMGGVKI